MAVVLADAAVVVIDIAVAVVLCYAFRERDKNKAKSSGQEHKNPNDTQAHRVCAMVKEAKFPVRVVLSVISLRLWAIARSPFSALRGVKTKEVTRESLSVSQHIRIAHRNRVILIIHETHFPVWVILSVVSLWLWAIAHSV